MWPDIIYVSLLLLSIAFGPFYQKIEDRSLKQWISTGVGLLLVIIVSGFHAFHALFTTVVNAIIITHLSSKVQHLYSIFFSFFYLLIVFRLGDWVDMPIPPTHTNLIVMMMTVKLPGLAFEINSAAQTSGDDPEGVNSEAMRKIDFMDVFHYSFNHMGVLTGPYYRYRTYWDSLHRPLSKNVDPWPHTFFKLKQIAVFIVLFLTMKGIVPAEYVLTEEYGEKPFLYRFFYMYPAFAVFRLRMFIGMALSECVCQMSGLGAYPTSTIPLPGRGPKDYKALVELSANPEKLKKEVMDFETVHNMDVWEVESTPLVRVCMKAWNACLQYWMATCVYKRFPNKNLRTMATMLLSALWHGYAAGYYFCICQVPFYLLFEDIAVKFYKQADENSSAKKGWSFFLWFNRLTCMAYFGVPFQLLTLYEILHFYKSLYFSGHFIILFLYIACVFLKPFILKRPAENKTKSQ